MNMAASLFFELLFLTMFSGIMASGSLYVSQNGVDETYCGLAVNSPCRTIHYALATMDKSIGEIILDGGRTKQMEYIISNTLLLTRNLTLQMKNDSIFFPVITSYNKTFNGYAFSKVSLEKIMIKFRYIQFVDIKFLECSDICDVEVIGCNITLNGVKDVTSILEFNQKSSLSCAKFSSLNIHDCIFNGISNTINSNALTVANISRCIFVGTVLALQRLKRLDVYNTIFSKSLSTVIKMKSGLWSCKASVNISKSQFIQLSTYGAILILINVFPANIEDINVTNSTANVSVIISCLSGEIKLKNIIIDNFISTYPGVLLQGVRTDIQISYLTVISSSLCTLTAHGGRLIFFNSNFIGNNCSKITYTDLTILYFENITIWNNIYGGSIHCSSPSFAFLRNIDINNNIRLRNNLFRSSTMHEIFIDQPFQNNREQRVSVYNLSVNAYNDLFEIAYIQVHKGILRIQDFYFRTSQLREDVVIFSFNNLHARLDIKGQTSCSSGYMPKPKSELMECDLHQYKIKCLPACADGSYSIKHGLVETNIKSIGRSGVNITNNNSQMHCFPCPIGGICDNGKIKSRGNFYGYKTAEEISVSYLVCPISYCCSSEKDCISYNTCALRRTGTLCGICKKGFQENMFGMQCKKTSECKSPLLFWIVFGIVVASVTFIVTFIDVCILGAKNFYIKFKSKIMKCLRPEKCENHKCVYSKSVQGDNNIAIIESDFITHLRRRQLNVESENNLYVYKEHSQKTETSDDCVEQDLYTTSGIINNVMSFYQIKSLLSINFKIDTGNAEKPGLIDIIKELFGWNLLIQINSSLCPYLKLDAVTKYFIKDFLLNISMVALILITILVQFTIRKCSRSAPNEKRTAKSLRQRLFVGYIRILLLVYKSLAFFSLTMINCVTLNEKKVLFIQGNRQCFQYWQYGIMVFLTGWVIPFPFALCQSYRLYTTCKITERDMLACLSFPAATLWFSMRCRHSLEFNCDRKSSMYYQSTKEMFTTPYRLKTDSQEEYIFWEHWRLIQRLILAAVTTYFIDPLQRICYITPCVLLIMIVYFKVHPLKRNLSVLHWCEVISMVGFCFQLVVSCFDAFLFTYSIVPDEPVPSLQNFLWWVDASCSPITVLLIYFVFRPIWNKLIWCYKVGKEKIAED